MIIRRGVLWLILLALPALACSIGGNAATQSSQNTASTNLPSGGNPPAVTIEAPSTGSQAVVNQPFTVQVHATDSYGVTRIEMHEGGLIVASQALPAPDTDARALLNFRPTTIGSVTLEVVAYRETVGSSPVTITVDVVGSTAELTNPNSLNATSGVATGAICAPKTTVDKLNLRAGPGTNFTSLAQLNVAEQLNVIGRNNDSSWFEVKRNSNNTIGWVSSTYTAPNDGCDKAPIVTPAPIG